MLEVDTATLQSVGTELDDAGTAMDDVAATVAAIAGASHPEVSAGLEALTEAWAVAIGVLAEDVSFLSQQVTVAAEVYDTTDGSIATGMRGP